MGPGTSLGPAEGSVTLPHLFARCSCHRLKRPSKARSLKSYPPAPQNVTVFGDGVFKEVIKLKHGHEGGP